MRRTLAGVAALAVLVVGVVFFAARGQSPSLTSVAAPMQPSNGESDVMPIAVVERSITATPVAPEPSRPPTITIAAVGDMIFDRKVKALIATSGGAAPLRHVADLLRAPDITVGNLESPLSDGGTKDAAKDVTFRGDPRGIEGLANSGFDFLALANNHVLDYGPDALADTIAALDTAGIGYAGAGADRTAAKAVHDYVIVSFHRGVEYKDNANADQVRDAHIAVDAGADMVLSHHPHVIQGVEFYNGRLIAYSLGDFVFDHYSRKTGEAFILFAELGPDGVSDVNATPVYLDGNGAPAVVTGAEATTILERLKSISSPHGTSVVIEGSTARVLR